MKNNASRRTFQQVHRDSRPVGSIESELWTPTDMAARELALEAARLFELKHKRKGRRNGPLGGIGLEVLRALWSVVDFGSGRLEPSLQWIMATTGRCRDAVVTALKRLALCGFVKWSRRFAYTGERGVRGPQVQQVTNAYALDVPSDAAALIPERQGRAEVRNATPAEIRLARDQAAHRQRQVAHASALPFRMHHYRDTISYLKTLDLLLTECESVIPDESRSSYSKNGARTPVAS